jgi:hypothetical protein
MDGASVVHSDAEATRRSDGHVEEQSAVVQQLLSTWPCRAAAEFPAQSEVLQTAVDAQMAAEDLAVQAAMGQLLEGTANASAMAVTLAHFLQLPYGPSAVSAGWGQSAY